jgi:hypothetical protein
MNPSDLNLILDEEDDMNPILVEIENRAGESIRVGTRSKRADGLTVVGIDVGGGAEERAAIVAWLRAEADRHRDAADRARGLGREGAAARHGHVASSFYAACTRIESDAHLTTEPR